MPATARRGNPHAGIPRQRKCFQSAECSCAAMNASTGSHSRCFEVGASATASSRRWTQRGHPCADGPHFRRSAPPDSFVSCKRPFIKGPTCTVDPRQRQIDPLAAKIRLDLSSGVLEFRCQSTRVGSITPELRHLKKQNPGGRKCCESQAEQRGGGTGWSSWLRRYRSDKGALDVPSRVIMSPFAVGRCSGPETCCEA